MTVFLRIATAVCLAISGYLHAQLYAHGYHTIPVIGPAFLVQAAASFAVALLLVLGGPWLLQLAAAGLAAGSLAGFQARAVSQEAGNRARQGALVPPSLSYDIHTSNSRHPPGLPAFIRQQLPATARAS